MVIYMKQKQQTFSFKISDELKNEMINYFQFKKRDKTPPYAIFQADEEDTVVTLYESNKVVFQGISADVDANLWKDMEKHLNNIDIDFNEKQKTPPAVLPIPQGRSLKTAK